MMKEKKYIFRVKGSVIEIADFADMNAALEHAADLEACLADANDHETVEVEEAYLNVQHDDGGEDA